MRVEVDRQQCDATGFCVRIAPDLFTLDDEDGLVRAKLAQVPADLEDAALEAEAACPTSAIRAL